ncbi:MAG TPA: oligoendopeptidase F [Casimicrobiaceae bacterium]|jgi:oligoendopeptidase F
MSAATFAAAIAFSLANVSAAADRASIGEKYKWNLAEIYPTQSDWDKARQQIGAEIGKIGVRKGTLGRSADDLYRALAQRDAIGQQIARLSTYANLAHDIDTRVGRTQQMTQQAEQLNTDFSAATSWMRPEVLALGSDKIRAFIASDGRLRPYAHPLDDWLRYGPHTLDAGREELLAQTGRVADAGQTTWSTFTNADLPWPTITLSDGQSVRLDAPAYEHWRESSNRDDRIKVFRAFWTAYGQFTRTLGTTLNAQVQAHVFRNAARRYKSSLEAALFVDNIPVSVYTQLIADVHRGLPTLHRYLKLRGQMLGVDRLRYEDLYASIVAQYTRAFTPEEATELTLRAVAPLGDEYVSTLKGGLANRWTDWFPSEGKASGAYSAMVYGLHPFQLQNFTGRYGEVSTLAHESGHSMHSYFAAKAQPYVTWRYPTFIAEVASTLNEDLLTNAMLADAKTDDERLFLLGNELDFLRTTLFRQVLFAEFELRIHEMVEKDEPLTGDNLKALYLKLLREYYGHDQGVCDVDEMYATEWAFIPHFYFDFYVFQYATSVMASIALAEGIRSEAAAVPPSTKRRDEYLQMLRAGGSRYAYDILKGAGVDLATSAPFDAAMREMNRVMDRIETILAKRQAAR